MANFKLAVSNFKFSGKLFIGYLEGKSVLVETGILSLLTSIDLNLDWTMLTNIDF